MRRARASFCDLSTHILAGRWPVSALPRAKRRARLNTCRSRPVSARCTRCRCKNVFVLVLHSHHKSIGGRLTPSTSSSCSGRGSLASPVKTRHISWSSLSGLASEQGGVCLQKVAGASPDRRERQRVKLAPPGRGRNAFVLVSHSHDKTSRLRVGTKRCWTLAEDIILEWEERKKRRVGGGAPCESRKTCVILWVLTCSP